VADGGAAGAAAQGSNGAEWWIIWFCAVPSIGGLLMSLGLPWWTGAPFIFAPVALLVAARLYGVRQWLRRGRAASN